MATLDELSELIGFIIKDVKNELYEVTGLLIQNFVSNHKKQKDLSPTKVDTQCLFELLNNSINLTISSWLSTKILLNLINSKDQEQFAISLVMILLKNNQFFERVGEILSDNKDFTNCNYLIELINKLNKYSTTDLTERINQNQLINNFPFNNTAGEYPIISYLSGINKTFRNLYQLSLIHCKLNKNLNNSFIKNHLIFIQIMNKIMILWLTKEKDHLSPIFINLNNLKSFNILEDSIIRLIFKNQNSNQFWNCNSIISKDFKIESTNFDIKIRKPELFKPFINLLQAAIIGRPRKVSVVNSSIFMKSRSGSETGFNKDDGTSQISDLDTSHQNFGREVKKIGTISESTSVKHQDGNKTTINQSLDESNTNSSYEIPGNQLAEKNAERLNTLMGIKDAPIKKRGRPKNTLELHIGSSSLVIPQKSKRRLDDKIEIIDSINENTLLKTPRRSKKKKVENDLSEKKEISYSLNNHFENDEDLSPTKLINKMKKESRKYGKKRAVKPKKKDIWDLSSSVPPTPVPETPRYTRTTFFAKVVSPLDSMEQMSSPIQSVNDSLKNMSVIPDSQLSPTPLAVKYKLNPDSTTFCAILVPADQEQDKADSPSLIPTETTNDSSKAPKKDKPEEALQSISCIPINNRRTSNSIYDDNNKDQEVRSQNSGEIEVQDTQKTKGGEEHLNEKTIVVASEINSDGDYIDKQTDDPGAYRSSSTMKFSGNNDQKPIETIIQLPEKVNAKNIDSDRPQDYNVIGNSTEIEGNCPGSTDVSHTFLEETTTAKTTFMQYDQTIREFKADKSYDIMNEGLQLFSSNLINKLKSLDIFITNKEKQMRSDLEMEIQKIEKNHKEKLKRLNEYFNQESRKIFEDP